MSSPLFSVVIPAYNAGAFIEETLASVQQQTCGDWELIVVDDGSTDDTAQRLARVADARLRVHRTGNLGVSHARNTGVALATGRYIALLDADDLWAPTHLEQAAAFFAGHPDVLWWTSAWYMGREAAAAVPAAPSQVARYFGAPSLVAYPSTVVLHADSAKALLPLFPEEMSNAEDWAAWARYACHHPLIGFCPQADTLYRLREGSATATAAVAEGYADTLMALPRYFAALSPAPTPEQVRYFRYRTLQRWLVLFTRMQPAGWRAELAGQRPLLGRALYLLIRLATPLFFFSRRALCKLLYEVNRRQERAIRQSR